METSQSKNPKKTNELKTNAEKIRLTLLKQARTRGTPSLGPSTPGIKSILGPIQLKGLTMVNSSPFSAPSAVIIKKRNQNKRS
jgi:hypothetical protein